MRARKFAHPCALLPGQAGHNVKCQHNRPDWPIEGEATGLELATLRAELAAAKGREERLRGAVSEILGKQHVMKYAVSFIGKWGDDPVFVSPEQRKSECERVRESVEEWHRILCAALAEKEPS